MLKFQVEIVHSYTDNDNEESLYTLSIDGQTIQCGSIDTAGDIVKDYITSRLIDDGCY